MRFLALFLVSVTLVSCSKFGSGVAASQVKADAKAREPRPFVSEVTETDHDLVEQLQSEMGSLSEINKRMDFSSNALLGRESGWKQPSMPKEEKVDENLRVNFSFLDCVTYVEQSIALARSRTRADFEAELRKVRYRYGVVSFSHRLHFPEGEWIPENIRNKNLTNSTKVTAEVFNPKSYFTASTVIDKENWFKVFNPAYLDELRELFPHQLKFDANIDYIDFDTMWTNPLAERSTEELGNYPNEEEALFKQMSATEDAVQKKALQSELDKLRKETRLAGATLSTDFVKAMPEFSVVSLVKPSYRVEFEGKLVTNMLISHMGFVVKKGDKLFLRHAPSKAGSKVIEIPFENYYSNFLVSGSNLDQPDNRRSTWKGINVLTLQELP